MKKIIFTLWVIMLGLTSVNGQVWVQPGAAWHYEYWVPGMGGLWKMEYEKDTLIHGRVCQKITTLNYNVVKNHLGQTILLGPHKEKDQFTSVSGDTVFYLNQDTFFVLYNFGTSIGDSWIIATEKPEGSGSFLEHCDDTSRLLVTDTGRVFIHNTSYRFITIEPSGNSAIGIKGTYVERFGLLNTGFNEFQMMFPDWYQCDSMTAVVDWGFWRFKCFHDSTFALYNPHSEDCEHMINSIGMEEILLDQAKVYPNPSSGLLVISTPGRGFSVASVYNFQGALMKEIPLDKADNIINISDLSSGVYFIVLRGNDTGKNSSERRFKVLLR